MIVTPERLGHFITAKRVGMRISEEELAKRAKLHVHTVKRLESGESNPRLETMRLIFDVLGCELEIRQKGETK